MNCQDFEASGFRHLASFSRFRQKDSMVKGCRGAAGVGMGNSAQTQVSSIHGNFKTFKAFTTLQFGKDSTLSKS